MLDGIITQIICFFAKGWYYPYFEKYTQLKIFQGYSIESFQPQLNLLELAIQISAFIIVYVIIKLIKYLFSKIS